MPQFARASRRRRYCGAIPASQPTRSQPRPDAVLSIGELALLSSAGGLGKSTLVAAELVSAALLAADREPLTTHHGGEVQPQLPAPPMPARAEVGQSGRTAPPLKEHLEAPGGTALCLLLPPRPPGGGVCYQSSVPHKLPDRAWRRLVKIS